MADFVSSLGSSTYLPLETITIRFLCACLFGALIGVEREWRNRPAGLRTHILTALAAAVFTVLTGEILHAEFLQAPNSQSDPVRIIEAVTAGVAFLAAGAIIQGHRGVRGLTTGAGMWLAGALGVAAGLGFFAIGAIAAVLGMVVILVLKQVEVAVQSKRD